MYCPASLRVLCTKSVMVPALAEATAQSRGRLSKSNQHPEAQGSLLRKLDSSGSMNGPEKSQQQSDQGGQEGILNNVSNSKKPLTEQVMGANKKILTDSAGNKIYGVKILEPTETAQIMGANGTAKSGHHSVNKLHVSSVLTTQQSKQGMVHEGQLIYQNTGKSASSSSSGQTVQFPISLSNGIGSLAHKLQQPPPNLHTGCSSTKDAPTLNMVGLRLATTVGIPMTSTSKPLLSHTVSHTSTLSKAQQTFLIPVASTSGTSNSQSQQNTMEINKTKTAIDMDPCSNCNKKQIDLERRAERLIRRLRRLQSRQSVSHVQRELSAFVDHQSDVISRITGVSRTAPKDVETQLLQNEDVKNLSTAALVNLVRKLQTSHAQALRQRLSSSSQSSDAPPTITLEQDSCYEMKRVSGVLTQSLHHVQDTMDSDATESSSGGESCEEDNYEDNKPPSPALSSQARYQWAKNRASIISRWTWLQAQVSDLEYRIRQQNDIYRQIRTTKGPILLGEHPGPEDLLAKSRPKSGRRLSPIEQKIANLERKNELSPCPLSTLLNNTKRQSAKLIHSLGNVLSPASSCGTPGSSSTASSPWTPSSETANGNRDNTSDNLTSNENIVKPKIEPSVGDSPVVDDACQAARCRPVKPYRKRKLFRTAGLYHTNRKAARLSTVKCHCYPPVTPCPMCGGRYNNTQQVDPDTMSVPERAALLDHSYHQVLSFDQDICLKIHFESLLKNGDWLNKSALKSPRLLEQPSKRKYRDGGQEPKRKYTRRVNKNTSAAVLSSNRIKNKYEQKQLGRSGVPGTPKKDNKRYSDVKLKKRSRLGVIGSGSMKKREIMSDGESSPTLKELSATQSHGNKTFQDMKEILKKRRGESAYDINNIVIPYSMAASTRVEKLQYKEIITPSWRFIDENVEDTSNLGAGDGHAESKSETVMETKVETNSVCDTSSSSEEVEDISDEAFAQRHARCEMAEKKRFLAFAQINKRGGRPGRSDSVSSSTQSGALSRSASEVLLRNMSETSLSDLNGDTDIKFMQDLESETKADISEKDETFDLSKVELLSHRGRSASMNKLRTRSSSNFEQTLRTASESSLHTYVASWENRAFPLSESEFSIMKLGMDFPDTISTPPRPTLQTSSMELIDPGSGSSTLTVESGQGTPISTDDEIIEDPDDPEWTVTAENIRSQKSPGLVLKLSRR